MGPSTLCVHTAFDQRSPQVDPMGNLERVRAAVSSPIAVAGGLDRNSAARALHLGADIIIVGRSVIEAKERRDAARAVYEAVHKE